ncbi:YesL family protein [Lapidilactobacillus achengensis]|uniref:YesL family protein n=1 Tax=Lapidilactobacillus achengensis TaxID=2486000 RepID=A0ABW1UQ45_9LACO|nr:DUF624 domain-containing protein [Lapidilactobacillus achengensis]
MKFNTNSSFFRFMGTLFSFTGLNVLFLITCIPIFTIGPALASLYATTLKYIDNEDLPLVKNYWTAFRKNFKHGSLIFIILAAVVAIIGFNIAFWRKFNSVVAQPIFIILIIVLVLIAFLTELLFPLIGRFENTIRQTYQNAFLIAISNFFQTLLLLAIDASALALVYVSNFARVMFLIFGVAFVVYIKSFIVKRILTKYTA